MLNILVKEAYAAECKAGWNDGIEAENEHLAVGTKFALIHSEISEAMEGHRKDKMDDHLPHLKYVEVELADAMIRICALAGHLGLNLDRAWSEKMAYNAVRADHKREARAAEGGKKY